MGHFVSEMFIFSIWMLALSLSISLLLAFFLFLWMVEHRIAFKNGFTRIYICLAIIITIILFFSLVHTQMYPKYAHDFWHDAARSVVRSYFLLCCCQADRRNDKIIVQIKTREIKWQKRRKKRRKEGVTREKKIIGIWTSSIQWNGKEKRTECIWKSKERRQRIHSAAAETANCHLG